jgi:hypothetical protein
MKTNILLLIIFLLINFEIRSQELIIIWEELSFDNVKKVDLEKTCFQGRDTIIKNRLMKNAPVSIDLSGRFVNLGKDTIYIERFDNFYYFFKIEYSYKNRNYDFYIDYDHIEGSSDDIKLAPGTEYFFNLYEADPFNNNLVFSNNKQDYINPILEIIPTFTIKSKIAIKHKNQEDISYIEHKTKTIKYVSINWSNYILRGEEY